MTPWKRVAIKKAVNNAPAVYYGQFLRLIRATHTPLELDHARLLESLMLPPDGASGA